MKILVILIFGIILSFSIWVGENTRICDMNSYDIFYSKFSFGFEVIITIISIFSTRYIKNILLRAIIIKESSKNYLDDI